MVGVVTLPTSDSGERLQYPCGSSHGILPNQYLAKKAVLSEVRAKLAQSITGFCTAAALKRPVLPTIQAVSTPPPEPPVMKSSAGSTPPSPRASSTALIRSS